MSLMIEIALLTRTAKANPQGSLQLNIIDLILNNLAKLEYLYIIQLFINNFIECVYFQI